MIFPKNMLDPIGCRGGGREEVDKEIFVSKTFYFRNMQLSPNTLGLSSDVEFAIAGAVCPKTATHRVTVVLSRER